MFGNPIPLKTVQVSQPFNLQRYNGALTILFMPLKVLPTVSDETNTGCDSSALSGLVHDKKVDFSGGLSLGNCCIGTKARQLPNEPSLERSQTIEYKPNYPASNKCALGDPSEYQQALAGKPNDLDCPRTTSGRVIE